MRKLRIQIEWERFFTEFGLLGGLISEFTDTKIAT